MEMLAIRKHYLILIAGTFWIIAGAMVFATGLPVLIGIVSPVGVAAAASVYLVFYLFIFRKLVYKHVARIESSEAEKMPFYLFFDAPSYVVMAAMMSSGIVLRKFHLVPDAVIGPLYSGIGCALFSCGVRFAYVFAKKNTSRP